MSTSAKKIFFKKAINKIEVFISGSGGMDGSVFHQVPGWVELVSLQLEGLELSMEPFQDFLRCRCAVSCLVLVSAGLLKDYGC